MAGRSGIGRYRRFTALAFALYAVFLLTAQFEHHDLACELKTPQHCTSCASSQLGSASHTQTPLDGYRLADAGRPVSLHILPESTILSNHSSGRSPPSFS